MPEIDPSVANGNSNVPYYNGETATRASGELTYAFNIQRQIGDNMVAEVGYLGTLASDIQSSLLAYDQIPYRSLPANLNPFTAAGRTLLTSRSLRRLRLPPESRRPLRRLPGSSALARRLARRCGLTRSTR